MDNKMVGNSQTLGLPTSPHLTGLCRFPLSDTDLNRWRSCQPHEIRKSQIDFKAARPTDTIASTAIRFWQSAGQSHWHVVSGISMWPFLKPGDRVRVHATIDQTNSDHLTVEALQVGDVVLIQYGDRLVVHRITEMSNTGEIRTWGDFNLGPDPAVTIRQIVGKIVGIERNGEPLSMNGWRTLWAKTVLSFRPLLRPFIRGLRLVMRARNYVR